MGHRDFKTTLIYADYAPASQERELAEREPPPTSPTQYLVCWSTAFLAGAMAQ